MPITIDEDRRRADQHDRRPQRLADLGRHRPAAQDRVAEIALQRLLDVGDELLELRAVEVELLALGLDLLWRQVAAAEQLADRVVADDPEQEEVDDEDERQRRQRAEHPADDESEPHLAGSAASLAVVADDSRIAADADTTTRDAMPMISRVDPPSSPRAAADPRIGALSQCAGSIGGLPIALRQRCSAPPPPPPSSGSARSPTGWRTSARCW